MATDCTCTAYSPCAYHETLMEERIAQIRPAFEMIDRKEIKDLLEYAQLVIHYEKRHDSVPLGHHIHTCIDGLCPRFVAAIKKLE